MSKLISLVKNIRLGRIFTVLAAAFVLFFGTACNSPNVLAKTADKIREEVPSGMVTSEFKGGMNDYPDTDPRNPNVSAAEAKAQLLKDSAERRISNKASNNVPENIRRVADEGPEKLNQVGQKVKEDARTAAQRKIDEFGDNAKEGVANLQENTRGGVRGAKDIVSEATSGVRESADDAGHALETNLNRGADNVKNAGRDVKSNAENALNRASSKANRDINDARRAANNALDAVD